MWRLPHDLRDDSNTTSRVSTTSFSAYRPSTPSTAVGFDHTRKRKAMEELWKDINLSTLCNEPRPPLQGTGQDQSLRSMILQDFLAGAFRSPQSTTATDELSLPPTALSLSRPGGPSGPLNFPSHATTSTSPLSFTAEQSLLDEAPSCDRRYMRMMKNRESASRSRARKQAYTNELELEVAHLAKENMKLKQHNEELRLAMAAPIPKRTVLQRTASSPF